MVRLNLTFFKCLMRGVLLVNGLGANLYSIGKAKATGIEVFFTNDTVSFTRNGIALIEGRRAGKTLNHLNIQPMFYIPKTTTALRATKLLQLSTWHKRFGHVNSKILFKMASLGSTSGLTLFNENPSTFSGWCILGKMQRFPFNIRHEIATAPGQRIHSDICNLIQVTAASGDRYFVTFKDYYSNYCITTTKE